MKKRKGKTLIEVLVSLAIIVLVVLFLLGGFGMCRSQSRFKSRYLGKTLRLELPKDFAEMVNVSVRKGDKNVTYVDKDGNYRTKEYTDSGWFEGAMIWIKPEEDSNSE